MHKLSILSHFPLGGGLSYLRGADCFSAETNLASWDDFGQRRRQKAASIAGTTQDHVQGGRAPASVNRNSVRVLSVVPAQQRPPRVCQYSRVQLLLAHSGVPALRAGPFCAARRSAFPCCASVSSEKQ